MLTTLIAFLVILIVTVYLTTQINVRAFTEQQANAARRIAEQNAQLAALESKLAQTATAAEEKVKDEINALKSKAEEQKKKYQELEKKNRKLVSILEEMRTTASSREYTGNTMAKMIVRKIDGILPSGEQKEKNRLAETQGMFSRIKNRL